MLGTRKVHAFKTQHLQHASDVLRISTISRDSVRGDTLKQLMREANEEGKEAGKEAKQNKVEFSDDIQELPVLSEL